MAKPAELLGFVALFVLSALMAQYRRAAKSGHFIQNDEPELVIQAIRDLCGIQ